jgi:hypothetical protein
VIRIQPNHLDKWPQKVQESQIFAPKDLEGLMNRIRRSVVTCAIGLGLATLPSMAMFAVANPAHAAGGGCRHWENDYFAFDACIGDDGRSAFGDTYIQRVTTPCVMHVEIWESNSSYGYKVQEQTYSCSTGYRGPVAYPMIRGLKYGTRVWAERGVGGMSGGSPQAWRP